MEWFALSLKNYHLLLYRNITLNVHGSWMQKFHSSFIFLFVSRFSFTGTKSTFTCSKSSNRNTRKRCKICSKLTMKIPKRHHCCRSGVFIVNFEHISRLVLVFLLLTFRLQFASWVLTIQRIVEEETGHIYSSLPFALVHKIFV